MPASVTIEDNEAEFEASEADERATLALCDLLEEAGRGRMTLSELASRLRELTEAAPEHIDARAHLGSVLRERSRDCHRKRLRMQALTRKALEPFPQRFPQRQERALFSMQPRRRGQILPDLCSPPAVDRCQSPTVAAALDPLAGQPSVRQRRPRSPRDRHARVDVLTEA